MQNVPKLRILRPHRRLLLVPLLAIMLVIGSSAATPSHTYAFSWHWPFGNSKDKNKDKNGGSGGNTGGNTSGKTGGNGGGSGSSGGGGGSSGSGSGSGGSGGGDNSQPQDVPTACTGTHCVAQPSSNCNDNKCDLVALYVNPFINVLSLIVGLVAAASLIIGGIQYITSSGDPQKTSAAKSRIQNTLLAFLAYAFLYAFLNFLIPGGLFS